ncbi:recombinase RecA [Alicyclobacillus shizuokensis]|uniref:recombinase RecA n=1 Tax=Alicyclobacillus shizuokensis TaxID=392014 RepID=UPI0008376928|nr:recombinase RecA [Alicyclobacillus shizuokensis]
MTKAATDKDTPSRGYDVVADFNKRFGEGTFFTLDSTERASVFPVPTGIPSVDYASGIGGMPLGRIVEVYGPESAGKTTFCLMVAAQVQKLAREPEHRLYGKKVLFVDAEHALDPIHAQALGVNLSELVVTQPETGEQAFDLIEAACRSKQFALIIGDSVAAFTPRKIIEEGMDANHVGLQARMMSQGLSKIKGVAYESDTLCMFINQIREKVGVMYGNPETTTGGRALKFYATMRIEIRRKEIKKGDVHIGQATTVKFIKNKVARPFTVAEYDYYFDTGIDVLKSIVDVAIDTGVINRAGAYYFIGEDAKNPSCDSHGNQLKWQGKENLIAALRVSPALYEYINGIVLGHIPKGTQFVEETDDGAESADSELVADTLV